MPKEKLVIGKDITQEEFDRLFAKMKAVNQYFRLVCTDKAAKLHSGDDFKFHAYKTMTDEEIKEKILNPKYRELKAKTQIFQNMLKDFKAHTFGADLSSILKENADLSRFPFIEADMSYLLPGHEGDKERLFKENKEKIEKLADLEERKAFYKRVLEGLNKLDVSGLYTGTIEERIDFYIEHFNVIQTAFIALHDLRYAMEKDHVFDAWAESVLESKGKITEGLRLFESIMDGANQEIYPVLEGQEEMVFLFNHEMESMDFEPPEELGERFQNIYDVVSNVVTRPKVYEKFPDMNSQELALVDIESVSKNAGAAITYHNDLDRLSGPLQAIKEAGAMEYVVLDSKGKAVDFIEVCKRMNKGENVIFQESQPVDAEHPKRIGFEGLRRISQEELEFRQLNAQEKAQIVNQWFDSFHAALDNDPDFDVDNEYDIFKLHAVSLNESLEGAQMDADRDIFGNPYGSLRGTDFLSAAKKLADLTPQEKENLYTLAMRGQLSLHARDGSPKKERAIYIKKDGGAGMANLNQIYISDKALKEKAAAAQRNPLHGSFYDQVFPDAKDAKALTDYFHKAHQAVNRYVQEASKNPSHYAYVERAAFQLYAIRDASENKEYYANDRMKEERMTILNLALKDEVMRRYHVPGKHLADLNNPKYPQYDLKPELLGGVYNAHPIGESMTMHKMLREMEQKWTNQLGNEGSFFTSMGQCMMNEEGKPYSYNENRPWEASEKMTQDFINGKNIYLRNPSDNKYFMVKILPGKYEMQEVGMLSEKEKSNVDKWLTDMDHRLSDYGTTHNDSEEFKNLFKKLKEAREYFSNQNRIIDRDTFKTKIEELYNVSSVYFMAKLTQPQNGRRFHRAAVADALRIKAKELLTNSLGGDQKFYDNWLKDDMLAARAFAISKGDFQYQATNPDVFWEQVKEYKNSREFMVLKDGKDRALAIDSPELIEEKLKSAREEIKQQDMADRIMANPKLDMDNPFLNRK